MESTTQNDNINATKEVRELFNEIRSNIIRKERHNIRKKLHKKEVVHNYSKEKEQEGSLTNKQEKVLKNIDKYLKKLTKKNRKITKKIL